jgi:hypothetical protein
MMWSTVWNLFTIVAAAAAAEAAVTAAVNRNLSFSMDFHEMGFYVCFFYQYYVTK